MTDVAGNAVFQASRQRILPGAWVGIPGAKKLNSGDLRKEVMKANEKQRPTVRKAGPSDCKAIAELCEQRHREEDFYIAPFDQPKVEKLVGHLIDAPNGVVVVAEVGGRLVGELYETVIENGNLAKKRAPVKLSLGSVFDLQGAHPAQVGLAVLSKLHVSIGRPFASMPIERSHFVTTYDSNIHHHGLPNFIKPFHNAVLQHSL